MSKLPLTPQGGQVDWSKVPTTCLNFFDKYEWCMSKMMAGEQLKMLLTVLRPS